MHILTQYLIIADSEVYQRAKHELAKSAFVPMADFEDSYEKVTANIVHENLMHIGALR